MPDTFRYTSVSVSKQAHEDLTKVKDQISYEVGFDISIAKVIEKIAAQEAAKYAGNKRSSHMVGKIWRQK